MQKDRIASLFVSFAAISRSCLEVSANSSYSFGCAVFIGEIVGILVTGAYVLTQDPLGLVLTGISVLAVLLLSNLYNKYRLQQYIQSYRYAQ